MRFYDYCIFGSPGAGGGMIRAAGKLGWGGACVFSPGSSDSGPAGADATFDTVTGYMIETDKAHEVRKLAMRLRKSCEIIAVKGLNEEVNRAASETPEVDILLPAPESAVDYMMVKLAGKNGVSLGFEFSLLLSCQANMRGRAMASVRETARFVRKFRAPFVIVSGARSEWDLRAPGELETFGRSLGFEPASIRHAMSGSLAEKNRKKLGAGWIMPGVEVE